MIEKINIESFGTFKDFKWTKCVDSNLGKLNIIYGRNYSGKTTLSRIFRSIEQKKMHSDFENGSFTIDCSDQKSLSSINLENNDLKFRVYNSDFKLENLSFLSNKSGDILPFAILGEHNVEIEKMIVEKNKQLDQLKISLYGNEREQNSIKFEADEAKKELKNLNESLDNKLRTRAKNIKRNSKLFRIGMRGDYNIKNIKNEIEFANELSETEVTKLEQVLNEELKKTLKKLPQFKNKIKEYIEKSSQLVQKSINPSEAISYLINNPDLQDWVKEGIRHHKHKKDRCAFCNSELTNIIWSQLEKHFTEEAETHKKLVNSLIHDIENHIKNVNSKNLYKKEDFYIEFQDEYQTQLEKLAKYENIYFDNLNYLLSKLMLKSSNIYNEYFIDKTLINDSQSKIDNCISYINSLIEKNNKFSSGIEKREDTSLKKLRLHDIKKFIDEIEYQKEIEKIQLQAEKCTKKNREMNNTEIRIRRLTKEIYQLKSQLSDELKAAKKVNEYLSVYLGHPELFLEVNQNESHSTFVIKRGDEIAYNLSEGEQTLISFSYFLATLKDISKDKKNEYSIFIDDPICSLDGNNIFYIFSLIDSEIVEEQYKQIFISTHNLDFFKYLRRVGKKKTYLMIERQEKEENFSNSILMNMPNYMKEYVTEFIFLFNQINIVATKPQNNENYHIFYNFPNNARKFLESYLFFKYPNTKIKNDHRMKLFFKDSPELISFMQRINNEYSHGEEQFDRLSKPIDIPEFQKEAKLILNTIEKIDKEQYDAFINNIS
ncbi:AAA family ATPase [Exiguobacterium sp. ZWU0009]|uniref:AAA family ATPase n=1 Tax=Exiguobacterium sp. ZWU0009 TaxID=1224749 RepID=UPI000646D07F|nr:AAA family ATPase [Exiguobacterium sp. ZWU0009]